MIILPNNIVHTQSIRIRFYSNQISGNIKGSGFYIKSGDELIINDLIIDKKTISDTALFSIIDFKIVNINKVRISRCKFINAKIFFVLNA